MHPDAHAPIFIEIAETRRRVHGQPEYASTKVLFEFVGERLKK